MVQMGNISFKWTIFFANLNPVKGSEQRGNRPVLVISDEVFNRAMPVVTILQITSLKGGRKVYPNEVLLPKEAVGFPRDSLVLSHQIRTISKERLGKAIGAIKDIGVVEAINKTLKIHLNL